MAFDGIPTRELFIAGEWVAPSLGKYLDVVCPHTEEHIGKIPAGSKEDIHKAVEAAQKACLLWVKTTGKQRAAFLHAMAEKVWRGMSDAHH